MPLWKNELTNQEITAGEDFISAFPAGSWTKLADEAPEEIERRKQREQEEAIRNKVELEDDDAPAIPQDASPVLELGVIRHDDQNQEG